MIMINPFRSSIAADETRGGELIRLGTDAYLARSVGPDIPTFLGNPVVGADVVVLAVAPAVVDRDGRARGKLAHPGGGTTFGCTDQPEQKCVTIPTKPGIVPPQFPPPSLPPFDTLVLPRSWFDPGILAPENLRWPASLSDGVPGGPLLWFDTVADARASLDGTSPGEVGIYLVLMVSDASVWERVGSEWRLQSSIERPGNVVMIPLDEAS